MNERNDVIKMKGNLMTLIGNEINAGHARLPAVAKGCQAGLDPFPVILGRSDAGPAMLFPPPC